jgi:adenine-specific DNA-methyltransferase
MENFNEVLIELLKKDPRFVDNENNILRSKIIDAALTTDKELLSLLLTNKRIKDTFFSEVSGYWIFEANKFIDYIQDKNFLNDSYTKYRNKIGLTIDGKFLNERNEVALSFPFKDCILEGGQTKQESNRKEIFFNEILAQDEIDKLLAKKVLTNFKRYTEKGEEKVENLKRDSDGTIRDNLIIKGNNLLALHTIRDQFKGKIKLIYIDPPYNTGNDEFGYNDSFNHSTWLTFMKNRLEVARELLREDGVIFISIADKELAYLKILLDEVFDNNFIQTVAIKRATTAGFKAINLCPVTTKEFLLIYSKIRTKNTLNPVYVEVNNLENYDTFIENINENPKKWKFKSLHEVFYDSIKVKNSTEAYQKLGSNWKLQRDAFEYDFKLAHSEAIISFRDVHKPSNNINKLMIKSRENSNEVFIFERKNKDNMYFLKGRSITFLKNKIKNIDGKNAPAEILTDMWYDISWDGIAKEGGVILKNGKKPEKLIKRIIDLTFKKGEKGIVLDYHMGSGTACAVAHKMGLQYIGIEQLDYGENDSVTRLKNVIKGDQTGISKIVNWKGGGDFIYLELARYNQTFVDLISNAKSTNELLKILKDIEEKAFLKYNVDLKELDSSLEEFKKLTVEQQKETLILILNKNQLYVNLSDINDLRFNISEEDKKLNKKFYS